MPVVVTHTKVSTIADDPSSASSGEVLPSDWNANHTLTGIGTMAEQNSNAVNITGGSITGVSSITNITVSNKTSAYTVQASDVNTIINCTANTFTVDLTAAATLGAGFNCWIWNTSSTTSTITVNPFGSETIDGATTYPLRNNEKIRIVCTGSNWLIVDKPVTTSISELNTGSATTRATATGSYAIAGGYSVAAGVVSTATSTSSLGLFGRALTSYSVAIGANSSGALAVTNTSSAAVALNGSYSSGTDSFATGIVNNTISYGARGAGSVALMNTASATAPNSVAIGSSSSSTSTSSISIGTGSSATNLGSVAIGVGTSSGSFYGVSLGYYSSANSDGKFARASGRFALNGDAQNGNFVLRRLSTDTTPVVLTTNGSAVSVNNHVLVLPNSAFAFGGTVVARQQASAGTQSAAWKIEGLIRKEGTNASVTLVTSTVTAISNVPGWTLALSADTTNGCLTITATGAAATNIRWVATVQTSEVSYP